MRHEITGKNNRSTRHNSVTKGEFLSLTVSGHLGQVQESHLNIQVRVPLFHDNFCGKIPSRFNLVFMYRVLCWGSRHWNYSQGLREKGSCKIGLAWSSCMKKLT